MLSASSVSQNFSRQTTRPRTSAGSLSTIHSLPTAIWLMSSGQTSTFSPVSRTTAMIASRSGAWSCSFISSLRACALLVPGLSRPWISQYGV